MARPRLAAIATLALALAVLPSWWARADCRRTGPDVDVAIGIRTAPPFLFSDPIRGERGLNQDLWTSIERELEANGKIGKTEFVECPLGAQLQALAAGDLDLVISPLTITAERMERIDFTHQYLSSGITVAQRSSGGIDFASAFGILRDTLTREGMPRAILVFLVFNLVLAAYMARVLRQSADYEVIAREPVALRVCRYTLEAIVRTLGLKEIGDNFRSTLGRVLDIALGLIGTVLSATFFGVLTTALVGSVGGIREVRLPDLSRLRLATLVDSTSQSFLEQVQRADDARQANLQPGGDKPALELISSRPGPEADSPSPCVPVAQADAAARCVTAATWDGALQILAQGKVDAVLGDWAQLSYLARQPQYEGRIAVQSSTFRLEPYGWGVTPRRPELRAEVDRALIARIRQPEWRYLVQEYMGEGSISPE